MPLKYVLVCVLFLPPLVVAGSKLANARRAFDSRQIVALLANRDLVEVATGLTAPRDITRTVTLAPASPPGSAVGNYLAVTPSGMILALSPSGSSKRQELVFLSKSLKPLYRRLLRSNTTYRSLQVNHTAGTIYLAGNVGSDRKVGNPFVETRAATTGAQLRQTILRTTHHNWLVLSTALSSDDRYIAVSYHGLDTAGADWLPLIGKRTRCHDNTPSDGIACLLLHGEVSFRDHAIIATTGAEPFIERDLQGRLTRKWFAHLPGNHLMAFALSLDGGRVAVVGPCGYRGGLSIISLTQTRVQRFGYPNAICGDRIIFLDRHTVAIARNPLPVPEGLPSEIDIVDIASGHIRRRIPTSSEVLDLISLSS